MPRNTKAANLLFRTQIHPFTKKLSCPILRVPMLGVLVTILTVILVFICLLMSLVILMQRPKQEGLGAAFGGALTDRMLGSGTTDFLQRATVFMGVAFFVLSLTIATLMAYDRNADRESLSQDIKEAAGTPSAEETTTPAPGIDDVAPPSIDLQDLAPETGDTTPPPAPAPAGEEEENPAADAQDKPAEEGEGTDPAATTGGNAGEGENEETQGN